MRPIRVPPPLDPNQGDRAALRLVNDLALRERWAIDYQAERRGPAHDPLWVVTPAIMGEVHRGFQRCGKTIKDAENTCALAIWSSGYLNAAMTNLGVGGLPVC
ncbi:hypothetical protein B0J17DRAFT_720889 [Rhizoctonia solani]|nr:hypothetical protein B0J17DRAFT_720889 [Rhizoctonia solani]